MDYDSLFIRITQPSSPSSWFPFLPTIVTIVVFILGFVVNRIKDIAVTNDRVSIWEEFFLASLENLLDDVRRQIEHVVQLGTELKTKKRKGYTGSVESFAALPGLLSVPSSDLYLGIVKAKLGKREDNICIYNELFKSPQRCASFIEEFKSEFERFRVSYDKIQDTWDRSLRELAAFKDSRISEAIAQNLGNNMPVFLRGLINTFYNWQQKNTTDPEVTCEFLITPLRQLCQNNVGNADSMLLLSFVNESDRAYDQFCNFLTFYSEVCELFSESLIEIEAKAKSNLEKARQLSPRKRWYTMVESWFRQWR